MESKVWRPGAAAPRNGASTGFPLVSLAPDRPGRRSRHNAGSGGGDRRPLQRRRV